MRKRHLGRSSFWLLVALVTIGCSAAIVAFLKDATPAKTPVPEPATQSPRGIVKDDKLLSLKSRQLLWDIEHIAFSLEQKAFPLIKNAFLKNDSQGLAEFLASDFTSEAPATEWNEVITRGPVSARFKSLSDSKRRILDAGQFVSELLSLRHAFDDSAESCRISIGLVRLNPRDHKDLHSPWEGVWRFFLRGTYGAKRREMSFTIHVNLETLDDAMHNRQHWIRTARLENAWLTESPGSLLEETTAASGIAVERFVDNWDGRGQFNPVTGGVYLADYDQDQVLDMLVEDTNTGGLLYRGLGDGTFEDVTSQAGLSRITSGAPLWTLSCWADLDGDCDEDLILAESLYENLGNGTFRDVSGQSNLALAPAEGYAVADFDCDGRIDIYVCHSAPYLPGQKAPAKVEWIDGGLGIDNVLWRNKGNWQFEDVTEQTGTGGKGSACFAAVWFDANRDQYSDLLAINEFGRNSLFLSRGDGTFTEGDIDPIFGGFSMGVTSGDYNNDGATDLYVANMYSKAGNRILANVVEQDYPRELYEKVREATTGSKLYRGREKSGFDVVPPTIAHAEVGWAYGANFVDLDGDGFQDLYATAGFQSVERGKPDG